MFDWYLRYCAPIGGCRSTSTSSAARPLYARSVFFMWVTVIILVIAGIAGAGIAQARVDSAVDHLGDDRTGGRIPIWIGRGTTAAFAATLPWSRCSSTRVW